MTSKDNLVARARTAVVRRLDPVAAKRTATLAERRTNGVEATPEVAAALDATAALAVRDLAQRIRSGDLDAHHQAALREALLEVGRTRRTDTSSRVPMLRQPDPSGQVVVWRRGH